ncbi:MAG: DUF58 domain-containing protein [Thermoplasmatota archaeon]
MADTELTRLGRFVILIPIFLFILGFLLQTPFSVLVGAGILSLIFYSRYSIKETPDPDISDHVVKGNKHVDEPFQVTHSIKTELATRVNIDVALDESFTVKNPPKLQSTINSQEDIKYKAVPKSRGYHELGKLTGFIYDPLKLYKSKFEHKIDITLSIQSSKEAIRRAQTYTRRRHAEEFITGEVSLAMRSNEFEGIREYQPGDSFKDIHWKSLSKFQKYMTRVYEKIAPINCHIMIDCSQSMRRKLSDGTTKLDQAVYVATEILKNFDLLGHGIGLTAYDHKKVLFHQNPGQKKEAFQRIYNNLPKLPGPIETNKSDFERYKRRIDKDTLDKYEEMFSRKVSKFVSPTSQKELSGVLSAVTQIRSTNIEKSLILIFSDLETFPYATIKSVENLKMLQNQIWMVVPFSSWYEADEVDKKVLERAYKDYEKLEEILHRLERLDVSVFELHPEKEGFMILEERGSRKR